MATSMLVFQVVFGRYFSAVRRFVAIIRSGSKRSAINSAIIIGRPPREILMMFKLKVRNSEHSRATQRHLFQIQQLIQELVKAANQSERAGEDAEATTPQDLEAVRALQRVRQTLLDAVQVAMADGVERDAICTQGIDCAVSRLIVMSELAHYMVGEIRSRV